MYYMINYEEIITFESLLESAYKCKRGVMWKGSVAHFMLNVASEVLKLSQELQNGTYKERPKQTFLIKCPKEREIVSISFRDRVYQRSLNDNAIYPIMSKSLIYDNAACQTGKGTTFARRRFKTHAQRLWRENPGQEIYVLKLDIKQYYKSIKHEVAKDIFRASLPPDLYEKVAIILDSYYGDVGYNPGSQLIQIVGISLLNIIDHGIKEQLRAKHYIRHMDDMIIFSHNKQQLNEYKVAIEHELAKFGLSLHEKKTKIYKLSESILFLGFYYHITSTGKIIMTADPVRVKAYRKKLYRLVKLGKNGKMTRQEVDLCFRSWCAHVSQGNSYNLIMRMQEYYNNLWKSDIK